MSPQYSFDSPLSTLSYEIFVKTAGCGNASAVFECLTRADTRVLQDANVKVATNGIQGIIALQPVTDGAYIKKLASVQMREKRVNGEKLFVGVGWLAWAV